MFFLKKLKNLQYVIWSPLFIFFLCIMFPSFAEDFNRFELKRFLHVIAMVEEGEWPRMETQIKQCIPTWLCSASLRDALNSLRATVLESDDLELIHLYRRAVRNHDMLSTEKVDPIASYYKHYQPPAFLIPTIHLTFDVAESQVVVMTELTVQRNNGETSYLILDGREHQVMQVWINNRILMKEEYKVTPHELILFSIPSDSSFQVKVKSKINPFNNTSLEGMYACGPWLTTQCESEGARRIFFTLDRPDVLSRITTTIIADPQRYPYRLANGNFVCEHVAADGRASITWDDPYPKPSYLFACVLGHFSQLTSQFKTRSGKEVKLQIFVEPGKESRAHYALFALEKAMKFDEEFFDREYDLAELKMVAIPDFNSGAMENKGLMIFNDICLLVDDQSGTDRSYREVAQVVAHEYFHNWSGNRVTIRNWFEIALKEALTDLKAMLFSEWLFGAEFVRPKAVRALRELQFPEEMSEEGHPIMVESYVDAHSIYDHTTYTKGREVFRALKNYIDTFIPDGFREVQNLYFSCYDGQAVTFKELLHAANQVLRRAGKDLSSFERWFYQRGTPIVQATMHYHEAEGVAEIFLTQSCPHPRTGQQQVPLQIPFSLELLARDGRVICPKFPCILEEETHCFKIPALEKPIPIFMHGYSAPIILHYAYTLEDLACIIKYTADAFSRWEAAQQYSILAIQEMMNRIARDPSLEQRAKNGELIFTDLHQLYVQALESPGLSPLAKAQVIEIPSVRALSQSFESYDFAKIDQMRTLFTQQLALVCKSCLEKLLEQYPAPTLYKPHADQMQVRELRQASLYLLGLVDPTYKEKIFHQYKAATNFDDRLSALRLCISIGSPYKEEVIDDFYQHWKKDKAVFNFWLSSQASASDCHVEDLQRLEAVEGYDSKNPNHIRSIFGAFLANLTRYHEPSGDGYRYIVNKILEVAQFNPLLAHNYLVTPAFLDFEKLPPHQQALMAKELERLCGDDVPDQTRDLAKRMLERYRAQ